MRTFPKDDLVGRVELTLNVKHLRTSYEFDYTNNSQPISSQAETSYVIPGSSGSAYLTQPSLSHQLGPNHSSHASAYSALSASLASLKSRLNARGVSLSSPISTDPNSSTSLYSTGSGAAYSPNLLGDSGHQQQQSQVQSQPTYLNVGNSAQDSQSSSGGGYGSSQSQSNDNKTIVLAIPAKINFLADGRSSGGSSKQQQQQQQQVQQQQQLTVLQPAGDQQANSAYSSKQLGKCQAEPAQDSFELNN